MYKNYGSLRNGNRNFIVALVATIVLFWYLTSLWEARPRESAVLEYFMNHDGDSQAVPSEKSSFDWASVEFSYPPTEQLPLPKGRVAGLPRVQHAFGPEPPHVKDTRESRRAEVRKLFLKDWEAYRKFAWMKDALKPMTGGHVDQFSGWAATLVDTLDTLWIMGLREEFDEAVAAVAKIDFGKSTSSRVNTFETNIRYLGGLLSAYDLSKRQVLLDKATELGNLLYGAFNTQNRMPVDFIDFQRAKTGQGLTVEHSVVSASPGTLSMEMTRLSQITGDPKYYSAASRVMRLFYEHQNETKLPGIWPTFVSMSRQDVVSGYQFTLAGCADSLYEYLPKMVALLSGSEPMYDIMSRAFMDTAARHMLFRPMLPGGEDILIPGPATVDSNGAVSLDPESEHLACYIGAAFALGGRLTGRDDHIETGAKLAHGCIYAYRAMPSGMMPERYNMVACESRDDCRWDEERWNQEKTRRPEWKEHLPKGFTTAKDPRYILRPEAIESVLVLHRVTGRPEFQDAAWDMFTAVRNATHTDVASASVRDVTTAGPFELEDYQESFWLAETLKYYYLVFSPPDVISLDDFVFNTEAHPFRRPK